MNRLDCRGLACPLPVIETKKALAGAGDTLEVLVDNQTAKENVIKFATAQQCGVNVENEGDNFSIKITKPAAAKVPARQQGGRIWIITQDTLGNGSKELGAVLMKSFFYTLTEQEPPEKLLFINSGVMLTLVDSPVLGHIKTLAEAGADVLSCGTCLDYYAVKDQLAAGGVTNMYAIVEAMSSGRAAIL